MLAKFRKWMNFNPPPTHDMDGWNEFEDEFKKEAPIRYFIKYFIVLKIGGFFASLSHIGWAIRYRTVSKYHIVNTQLEPGYHEVDTRMLHASFELLVDYVEIECANMVGVADKGKLAPNSIRGWKDKHLPSIMKVKEFRSRELGIQHLQWETTLNAAELNEYERSPQQAAKAVQILILYTWWKDVYPNREEVPHPDRESVHFLEFLSKKWKKKNPEASAKIEAWSRSVYEQELDWDKEEEEMLIALMKIRKGLWT
jgi:hypothetical protein